MKRLVKDIIKQKKLDEYISIAPQASVFKALNMLEVTKTSALLVLENENLRGIFSEKDFARNAIRRVIDLSEPVKSIMTSRVYYVHDTFTLEDCMSVMSKVHVRHLPVMKDDSVVAFISMRHIMEALVEDKQSKIQELTSYITGSASVHDFEEVLNSKNVPIYSTVYNKEAV